MYRVGRWQSRALPAAATATRRPAGPTGRPSRAHPGWARLVKRGLGICRGQAPFAGPAAQLCLRMQHSTQLQTARVSTWVKIAGLLCCTHSRPTPTQGSTSDGTPVSRHQQGAALSATTARARERRPGAGISRSLPHPQRPRRPWPRRPHLPGTDCGKLRGSPAAPPRRGPTVTAVGRR